MNWSNYRVEMRKTSSLWQKIRDLSMLSFDQVYELLGVSLTMPTERAFTAIK